MPSTRKRVTSKKPQKKALDPPTPAKAIQQKPGKTAKPSSRRKTTLNKPAPQISEEVFPIVGLGASAGGLEAFEEFFTQMSSTSGLAFVVVPHQHPEHVSLLPNLLQKCTTMPVMEVSDGLRVEPNSVYVALAGKNVAILNTTFQLMTPDSSDRIPLPIDYFFRSLATDQKHQAIGIILSGTGSDGTLGLKAIKGETGMTMAQKPQAAKYDGMPRSAIATGVVDFVCAPTDMPEQLIAYICGPYLNPVSSPSKKMLSTSDVVQKIFVLLRDRTGNDFSQYKINTIRRRIDRRMTIHQIETAPAYLRYLLANPHEIDALFQEILIGVTSFFRDPQAFSTLTNKGFPLWLDSTQDEAAVRIWIPGCSTGEEAYSFAMLLREYMTRVQVHFKIQIFGTDLDSQAIEVARNALYPAGIANDVTPERLERFFTKEDTNFRVRKDLRDLVTFAPHNILTDPPFTKLNVLSCRNLLIYLESQVQRRLIPLFRYALKPQGGLFLGSSETTGDPTGDLFGLLDKKWKLYTRKPGKTDRPVLKAFPIGRPHEMLEPLNEPPRPTPSIANLIETMLLTQYAPSSVIVNERGEIVYIHGRTGAYLEPAPGSPNQLLLNMAREGLQYDLAAALREASMPENEEVVRPGIRVKTNGDFTLVDVTVKRINSHEALQGLFQVTFVSASETPPRFAKKKKRAGAPPTVKSTTKVITELEYTKQRLQHTLEEVQTVNEELKSTNEELQATNEESQSTNEELETSKEEMQSLNEELLTVNAQLQIKIEDLDVINDDLHNLLNSLDIATIFLDNDLQIKRFTPTVKRVINLIPSDVGRPLEDLVTKFQDDGFMDEAKDVLQTLVFREHEIRTMDGEWYFRRIIPYRTTKNTIDGLVMTFLNITNVKQAEIHAIEAQVYADSLFQTVREPLLVLDGELCVISANKAFVETFKLSLELIVQQRVYDIGDGMWNIPALRQLLEEVLPDNKLFEDFRVEWDFPTIGKHGFLLNARRVERATDLTPLILLAMEVSTSSQP